MLRGVLDCRRMKPARSRVSTIWCTEGRADTEVLLHVAFGRQLAVEAHVQVDKRQILALLGREDFFRATHAGHPIQLFVRASA